MSLSSFLGGVGRVALGAITGGPAGAIRAGAGLVTANNPGLGFGASKPLGQLPVLGGIGGPGGFSVGRTLFGGGSGRVEPSNGGCPSGYHLNKGTTADGLPPRSICVRNRHLNALNGRAAMRALRRIKRARKLTRKLDAVGASRRSPAVRSGHKAGCGCVTCRRR